MANIIMEYWGKQKIPIAWVIAILSMTYVVHEWADMHFITTAQGAHNEEETRALIAVNGTLIRNHLIEYDRNELVKEIKRVKNQQYELQQFCAVNGSNKLSDDRGEELRQELAELLAVQACVQAGHETCR